MRTDCPGIVDWPRAHRSIAGLRDRDQEGLTNALVLCKRVEKGDEHGLCQGLWSLKRAEQALSHDAMLTALRATTGDTRVCSAAAGIDRQRESLYQQIVAQIAECQEMAEDIRERIRKWDSAWKKVQETWNSLLVQHRFSSDSEPARKFCEAATEFAKICPNWSEFQNILRTAYRKGLHHEALRRDWLR
jgi:hypothetical protein